MRPYVWIWLFARPNPAAKYNLLPPSHCFDYIIFSKMHSASLNLFFIFLVLLNQLFWNCLSVSLIQLWLQSLAKCLFFLSDMPECLNWPGHAILLISSQFRSKISPLMLNMFIIFNRITFHWGSFSKLIFFFVEIVTICKFNATLQCFYK